MFIFLILLMLMMLSSPSCKGLTSHRSHGSQVGREPMKLPVMVFIHGESYDWNSGNPYDGSVLASYGGVVVVTINYRLGVLGFLPAFDGTARGNYGLMDQVAALHWIQENIAEFGGDATNVTIFGQGHGAACVNLLMVSPMARGLFQRAIMQSGSAFSPWAISREAGTHTRYLASVLACPLRDNTALVDCIRQRPISDIMRVKLSVPDHLTAFGPTIDGIVIPNEPAVLMKNYKDLYGQYDLLLGLTRIEAYFQFSAHEERFGIDSNRRDKLLRTLVRNVFTFHLQEIFLTILNEYTDWLHPEQHPLNIFETTVSAMGDVLTVAPMLKAANYHSVGHSRTFFYVFDHQTEEGDYSPRLGCITGEDLPYVFGAPLVAGMAHFTTNYSRTEFSLSETVMTYWTNFAKVGDPNVIFHDDDDMEEPGSPRYSSVSWPQYDRQHQRFLSIGLKSKIRDHYHSHRLSFWLHLIPSLNRPGEGNVSYDHHMLDEHDNMLTYDGHVRQVPTNIAHVTTEDTFFPPLPLPTVADVPNITEPTEVPSVPSTTTAITTDIAGNLTASETTVMTAVERTTVVATSGLDMGAYSTALSVTIAVGCSLLILNVLIFAGVYYQRDKNKTECAMQKAHCQQREGRVQGEPNPVPSGTKQHPIRAPPPSPVGQYLQVQDFTYPTMPAHYLNSLPPKPGAMPPPKEPMPEAQPLLPQGEARMMSHLWPPPQEITV